ncbi:hypothetical protein [Psychrobacter sp. W2-37-MNA-CIBAN-0211]|uniref:hypothetical protein n=1 Tax=Psychrobacter sp. W2-37-MNA-CIBAN-0211 TaxID=3140443 RepID=UPI0033235581
MADTPASTTKTTITDQWLNVSDGACTLQSVIDRDSYSKTFFDVVIGGTEPADDTDAFIRITLSVHANFHQNVPVWLRLNTISAGKDQPVIVIK